MQHDRFGFWTKRLACCGFICSQLSGALGFRGNLWKLIHPCFYDFIQTTFKSVDDGCITHLLIKPVAVFSQSVSQVRMRPWRQATRLPSSHDDRWRCCNLYRKKTSIIFNIMMPGDAGTTWRTAPAVVRGKFLSWNRICSQPSWSMCEVRCLPLYMSAQHWFRRLLIRG